MIWYDEVYLEDLGLYLRENPLTAIGFLPETVDSIYESDGLDGSIHQGSNFGPRRFSLDFVLVADTREELDQRLSEIKSLFWKNEPRPLVYEGNPRQELRCLINAEVNEANTFLYKDLTVSMIAPDPFWYSRVESTQNLSLGSNELLSDGNYKTPFILSLRGPSPDLVIKINEAEIIHGGLENNETLVIDTEKKTILCNGNPTYSNKVYPYLKPGINDIIIPSGSDPKIIWRDRWL